MSVAIEKKDPMYTWTFSHRSLLIRLYLWIYKPDNPSSTTFCKLFWGTILSPLTLSILIIVNTVCAVGRSIRWTWRHTAIAWRDSARQRAIELAQEERKGWCNYCRDGIHWHDDPRFPHNDCSCRHGSCAKKVKKVVPSPITPSRPNIPSRVVAVISAKADQVAAYFQAHPQIGETVSNATTAAGKVAVRGVFYPLMVLVPLCVFAFLGWQILLHWHGPVHSAPFLFAHTRHLIASAGAHAGAFAVLALKLIGVWLAALAAFVILFYVSCKGVMWYERHFPYEPHYPDSSKPAIPAPLYNNRDGVIYQAVDVAKARWGHQAALATKWATFPLWIVPVALWVILRAFGRGAATTGRFLVAGHHSVKYRTCPRILITEDEAA